MELEDPTEHRRLLLKVILQISGVDRSPGYGILQAILNIVMKFQVP
jgi:hypothetical protein